LPTEIVDDLHAATVGDSANFLVEFGGRVVDDVIRAGRRATTPPSLLSRPS
jgi:hypothetical protein